MLPIFAGRDRGLLEHAPAWPPAFFRRQGQGIDTIQAEESPGVPWPDRKKNWGAHVVHHQAHRICKSVYIYTYVYIYIYICIRVYIYIYKYI